MMDELSVVSNGQDDAAAMEQTEIQAQAQTVGNAGDDGREQIPQAEIDRAIGLRLRAQREKLEREFDERLAGLTQEQAQGERADDTASFIRDLARQEAEIRQQDPKFDLLAVLKDQPVAKTMLSMGEPLQRVYAYLNLGSSIKKAEQAARNEIINQIQSRNMRPSSIGSGGQGDSRMDIHRMSEDELRQIDERLKRGEKVRI